MVNDACRGQDGTEGRRDRRRLTGQANQMQTAVAAVELAVDGLHAKARLVVLHEALRNAVNAFDRLARRPDV